MRRPKAAIDNLSSRKIEGSEKMFCNLKAEMKRAGISLGAFAAKLGISESAATKKLAGKNEFKLSEIQAAIELFPGCTWDYLFEQDNPPEKATA